MVRGSLLETLNTSGPLLSNKIFCPEIKSIQDQKKETNVFTRNLVLYSAGVWDLLY